MLRARRGALLLATAFCLTGFRAGGADASVTLIFDTKPSRFTSTGGDVAGNGGYSIDIAHGSADYRITYAPSSQNLANFASGGLVSLGSFTVTDVTGKNPSTSPAGDGFTLSIHQTGPSSATVTDVATLTGSITSDRGALSLVFTLAGTGVTATALAGPNAATGVTGPALAGSDSVTYALQGLDPTTHALNLLPGGTVPSGVVNLNAIATVNNAGSGAVNGVSAGTVNGAGSGAVNSAGVGAVNGAGAPTLNDAAAAPEPSTLIGGCTAALMGLGYAARRRSRAAI